MIELKNVTHHYGIRPILRNLSMKIREGELISVMGPNGMGKSTLLGVIVGTLAPYKGEVLINGIARRSSEEAELTIRRQITYLSDHPWLPRERTGREFVCAVGELYDVDALHMMDHMDRLFHVFDLEKCADSPIRTYSNGQQKKLAVCTALITETPILVLDEPFSGGLDPSAILALKHILRRLAERDDRTVVIATQVPELVEGVAHRIALVRDGELIGFDTIDAFRSQYPDKENLQEILEAIINPHTQEKIDRYFQEPQK